MKKKNNFPASELAPAFKRFSAAHNARPHLLAYMLDRKPAHIYEAVDEYRKLGVPLSPTMRRNLEHARIQGKADKHMTEVRILQAVFACYGTIPGRIPVALQKQLAAKYKTPPGNVRTIISRCRDRLAKVEEAIVVDITEVWNPHARK